MISLILTLLAAVSALQNKDIQEIAASGVKLQKPCMLLETMSEFEDHHHEHDWKCELHGPDAPGGMMTHKVIKNLPANVSWLNENSIGKWIFHPDAEIEGGFLNFRGKEPQLVEGVKLEEGAHTLMHPVHLAFHTGATITGVKTVLAIRVTARDSVTTASAAQISDDVFGNGRDPFNLASGFSTCSYNKLRFVPYNGRTSTGVTIANGVTDVTISINVRGATMGSVEDDVLRAAASRLGNLAAQFNYVMLCLPAGVTGGIAYAYVGGYVSVYNDNWCRYPSAQMHEIGHNLRLAHSGEGSGQYADQTGMMGFSYSQDDGPVMCFNGPKLWQLGWYSDATLTTSNWRGKLVSLCNYAQRGSSLIVVKINPEYYVSFNRAAGCTSGTVEARNQVVVHRYQGTGYAQSYLLAKLSAGGTYMAGSTPIKVNSISLSGVAFADVTIGNPPTPAPTPAPTPGRNRCTRPRNWCSHGGSIFSYVDCDQDGVIDPVCTDISGNFWVRESSRNCVQRYGGGGTSGCRAACSRPTRWCSHSGSIYSLADCDGDGTADPVCTDTSGNFWTRESSRGCAQRYGRPAACRNCARPYRWCSHPGSIFILGDCDGDGRDDPICSDTYGRLWHLQSSRSCQQSYSTGGCPGGCNRPRGWCSHAGSIYVLGDVDRDGKLDPICTDTQGRFWTRLSGSNCQQQYGVLLENSSVYNLTRSSRMNSRMGNLLLDSGNTTIVDPLAGDIKILDDDYNPLASDIDDTAPLPDPLVDGSE